MENLSLKDLLYKRLHAKGFPTKGMITWNNSWLKRIEALPEGEFKEKEIDEGLASLMACYQDVLEGKNYRLVPFFGDAIPDSNITPECQKELDDLNAEMEVVPDAEFNTDAKQKYFKDKYWVLVEKYRGFGSIQAEVKAA